MFKLKNNESGSGLVEVLLALVIIAAIGAVGWFVIKNHNKSSVSSAATATTTSKPSASSIKQIALSDLGVKVLDPENRGLKLNTHSYSDAYNKTHTIHYVTLDNNKYQTQCGNPVSVYSDEEVTAKAHDPNDKSITYVQIGSNWYSVGIGEAYSGTVYCQDGSTVTGYNTFVEDLIKYVSANLKTN